jgi:alkylhydroperoxidase/carboxymuconolactone decarboxylase family protein YurZ
MPANPTMVSVDAAMVRDLLARRDELVRAITAGMASGAWDQVMGPFDGLLSAIKGLEEVLTISERQAC